MLLHRIQSLKNRQVRKKFALLMTLLVPVPGD